MRRRNTILGASLILALLLVAGPAYGAAFSDTRGHWAEGSMVELSKYGLVNGYPDGTFKPNNSVTRLEAVAMILNAAGHRQQAEAIDPGRTGLTFPPGTTWGKGHLALAVEKGIITAEGLSGFTPSRAASRLEVAAILCLALNLPMDYTPLSFYDASKINTVYQPYVATVVKNELIMGMPGNQFMPDTPVTRAQISAMLLRAIDSGLVNPYENHSTFGRLTETAGDGGSFTIRNIHGTKQTKVAADYIVLKDEKLVSVSVLSRGDRVKAILNATGQAVVIKVLPDNLTADQKVKGLIIGTNTIGGQFRLNLEVSGRAESLPVYQDARIYKDSREETVTVLGRDNYVEAELDIRGTVWRVTVHEARKVTGAIVKVSTGSITLRSLGKDREYDVDQRVRVTRNVIREMSYHELERGNRVELVVLGDTVYHIDFLSDSTNELRGIFSRLRADRFYVYTNQGEQDYEVARYVEVIRKDKVIDLSRINRGELVAYELDSAGRVILVEVLDEQNMDIEGKVSYVTSNTVGILDAGGMDFHYNVSSTVKVLRYGDLINLLDIVPGAKVEIVLEKGLVAEIKVIDDQNLTLRGLVVNINQDRGRITLEINRLRYTYDLASAVVITNAVGKHVKLADIDECYVDVKLDRGQVTEIKLSA